MGDRQISWQHTNRRQDSFVIEGRRQDLEVAYRSLRRLSESWAQRLFPEKAWISSPRLESVFLRLLRGSESGRRSGLAKQKALGEVDADLAQSSQRRFKFD